MWYLFFSVPDDKSVVNHSGLNKERRLCSCTVLGWPHNWRCMPPTQNTSLAHASSIFVALLCKVKAVVLRTCCPWLVFTKGSGWKPPTHTHMHTSLHLQKDIINNRMLCVLTVKESKLKRLSSRILFFSVKSAFINRSLISHENSTGKCFISFEKGRSFYLKWLAYTIKSWKDSLFNYSCLFQLLYGCVKVSCETVLHFQLCNDVKFHIWGR